MTLLNYFLLVLLPVAVFSSISVKIYPGETESESSVTYKGQDKEPISSTERKSFGLTEENLKRATEKYMGKRCDEVFVNNPTPYGDVYSKYKWDLIKRILRPVGARIIGINSKPVAVATATYRNKHKKIAATYSTSVTQQVEESVGHTWSEGGELTIGQEINYSVNFGAGSVGGTTSLSYSSSWGKDKTESRTVTLGTTSAVQVTIPPGGTVVSTLTATQGSLDIEVDYVGKLTNGEVFCNYRDTYKGHHFYGIPIYLLQREIDIPKYVNSTEKISVGFYTNAEIDVTDGSTENEITEAPAGIIEVGDQKETDNTSTTTAKSNA